VHVCMFVCMYMYIHVCMYVCMYVRLSSAIAGRVKAESFLVSREIVYKMHFIYY
jgi:hypothetical protein